MEPDALVRGARRPHRDRRCRRPHRPLLRRSRLRRRKRLLRIFEPRRPAAAGLIVIPQGWNDRAMAEPAKTPMTEEQIRAATIGELQTHSAPVVLVDYDPEWPRLFDREARRIRGALGERRSEER